MNKPFLVDVPVKINIWIRPVCQRLQFEVLKKARPSILFLQSDGGRNEREWELINENRKLFEEGVDWDCQIYKIYSNENLGLYGMGKKTHEFIWSHVDRCILLEDDLIPSVSFFRFCAEMLEKYKDDTRINVIYGMNSMGVSENVTSDYFFSTEGSIWGFATWKRVYENRDYKLEYAQDSYLMSLLKERTKSNKLFWRKIEGYSKNPLFNNHPAGDEFFFAFDKYANNQLYIIPKYNLISCIGSGDDSAHAANMRYLPKPIRNLFRMKTYEMTFPLKHPRYVIPDMGFAKSINKIFARNDYPKQLYRNCVRFVKIIIYRDWGALSKKVGLVFHGNSHMEK